MVMIMMMVMVVMMVVVVVVVVRLVRHLGILYRYTSNCGEAPITWGRLGVSGHEDKKGYVMR